MFNRKEFLATVGSWKSEDKSELSCFAYVKVYASNRKINFCYTGLTNSQIAEFDYSGENFEAVAVNLLDLIKAIKAGKEKTVIFDCYSVDGTIKIDNLVSIKTSFPLSKIPEFPKLESNEFFTLSPETWQETKRLVIPHISDDETRYVMNCINFHKDENSTTVKIIATDGRTMAVQEIEVSAYVPEFSDKIVPIDNIHVIKNSPVEICLTEKFAIFTSKEGTVFCESIIRLIDGQFPNFNRVIPQYSKNYFEFSTLEMVNALKKIKPFIDKKNNAVILDIKEEEILISCDGIEISVRSYTNLSVSFRLNINYFLRSLSTVEKTKVYFGETNENAIYIRDTEILRVIMPMRAD